MCKEDYILDKVVFSDSELHGWLKNQHNKWQSVMAKSTLEQKLDMIPYFSRMIYAIIKSVEKEPIKHGRDKK